jgi:hypothetical protein
VQWAIAIFVNAARQHTFLKNGNRQPPDLTAKTLTIQYSRNCIFEEVLSSENLKLIVIPLVSAIQNMRGKITTGAII